MEVYYMQLTLREKDVCKCIIEGMSNTEIADFLYLSKHTVKSYVGQIIAKARVKNRTQLAYLLGKENIIQM